MGEFIKRSKRVTIEMTQTLKSKPALGYQSLRPMGHQFPGLKQELNEGFGPAKPCPPHHCLCCCAVQGKAEPLPSCQAADMGSRPGTGHRLRTCFAHTLVSPVLGYTEIHTSDAFSLFSGSREAARARGASQGIPSSERCSLQHYSLQHKHCGNAS